MQSKNWHIFDDLLSQWHQWSKEYQYAGWHKTSAMFTAAKSSRQWDSETECNEQRLRSSQMEAIDALITQLEQLHRVAIYMHARNCATGKSVWSSMALPRNLKERISVINAAKHCLLGKMISAGVL